MIPRACTGARGFLFAQILTHPQPFSLREKGE